MRNVQTRQSQVAAAGAPAPADQLGPREAVDFRTWLAQCQAQVESALAAHLNELKTSLEPHSRLPDAVLYSVRVGGKRVRPILVLETCRVCGGQTEAALPAAIAMELVHTFSLVHDDLPAMDDDDLRRGQPTNHKVFGEALAILAGDWLLAHAFSLLGSECFAPAVSAALVRTLADGTQRMIEGQGADIAGEARATDGKLVEYIHLHKTAALIETCCRLGATCAGASDDAVTALARYGRHLGVAFQIADDLLDATGAAERVGKGVGKDAAATKQTYPAAFGLAESQTRARREIEETMRALEPFGGRADRLRELARYVIRRDR